MTKLFTADGRTVIYIFLVDDIDWILAIANLSARKHTRPPDFRTFTMFESVSSAYELNESRSNRIIIS